MVCNLQPLKVPGRGVEGEQPFVCLKCLYPTDSISNVQSLSTLQHLSVSHHGAQQGEGRKLNFFKKQQGFFHMYTYEHKTILYQYQGKKKCTIQLARSLFFVGFFFKLLIHYVIKSNQSYLSVQSTQRNFASSCHFKLKRKQCSFAASGTWGSSHASQGSSLHYFHKSTLVKVQLVQNCSDSISCQLNPAMYLRQGHISARYSGKKTLSDHQLHKGSYQLLQHQLLGKVG